METTSDGKIVLSLDLGAVRRGFEARERLRERDGNSHLAPRHVEAEQHEEQRIRERAKLDQTVQSDKGRLLDIVA